MADEKSSVPAPVPAPASAVRPKLLDRQALERVLARAAELQGAGAIPESSDLISESQLLEIGSEVGIGSAMLNQALAEERTRVTVPEERGLVAQIAGASFATISLKCASVQSRSAGRVAASPACPPTAGKISLRRSRPG